MNRAPGACHDAHAYATSGLKALMDGIHQIADLGYVGVEGIDLVPIKRKPGQDLHENAKDANRTLSNIRAAAWGLINLKRRMIVTYE